MARRTRGRRSRPRSVGERRAAAAQPTGISRSRSPSAPWSETEASPRVFSPGIRLSHLPVAAPARPGSRGGTRSQQRGEHRGRCRERWATGAITNAVVTPHVPRIRVVVALRSRGAAPPLGGIHRREGDPAHSFARLGRGSSSAQALKASLAFTGVMCAVWATVVLTWWVRGDWPGLFAPLLTVVPLAALWLWVSLQFPHRDAPWKALVPGALLVSIGFHVLHGASGPPPGADWRSSDLALRRSRRHDDAALLRLHDGAPGRRCTRPQQLALRRARAEARRRSDRLIVKRG